MAGYHDIGWLRVGLGEDSRPAVFDQGRLQRVLSELPNPGSQYPSLSAFLGGRSRERYLQALFPRNNIRRHLSPAHVNLRYDIASLHAQRPILFADGLLTSNDQPLARQLGGFGLQTFWDPSEHNIITILWSRLIFSFADMVCIFVDDETAATNAMDFLARCSEIGSSSVFPSCIRPEVMIVLNLDDSKAKLRLPESITDVLKNAVSAGILSGYEVLDFCLNAASQPIKLNTVKTKITQKVDAMGISRFVDHARLNGTHMGALYKATLQHTLVDISVPFDIVAATRNDRPVSPAVKSHLIHYLSIGQAAGMQPQDLVDSIASAFFMDNYVPGMIGTLNL